MRILEISTELEFQKAKARISEIRDEIEGLEDEISLLQREEDDLSRDIEAYEKHLKKSEDSVFSVLLDHANKFWGNFTWTERTIVEKARHGQKLDREETHRLKLICMRELGVVL